MAKKKELTTGISMNRIYHTIIGDLSVSQEATIVRSFYKKIEGSDKKIVIDSNKIIATFNYTPLFSSQNKMELVELTQDVNFSKVLFQRIEFLYFSTFKECVYTLEQRKKSNLQDKIFFETEQNLFRLKKREEKTYRIFEYLSVNNDSNAYNHVRQLILYVNEQRLFIKEKNEIKLTKKVKDYFMDIENSIYNVVCIKMAQLIQVELDKFNNKVENQFKDKPKIQNKVLQYFKTLERLTKLDIVDLNSLLDLDENKQPAEKIVWKKSTSCLIDLIKGMEEEQLIFLNDKNINDFIIYHFYNKKSKNKYTASQIQSSKSTGSSIKFSSEVISILEKIKKNQLK